MPLHSIARSTIRSRALVMTFSFLTIVPQSWLSNIPIGENKNFYIASFLGVTVKCCSQGVIFKKTGHISTSIFRSSPKLRLRGFGFSGKRSSIYLNGVTGLLTSLTAYGGPR